MENTTFKILRSDVESLTFDAMLAANGCGSLTRTEVSTLQINVGKPCNQACHHCHVDAGPKRTEIMSSETADDVLAAIDRLRPAVVDITGGAPELNPNFERLVSGARRSGCHVIDRCNLTVLFVPAK